jgi:hypothetical protein
MEPFPAGQNESLSGANPELASNQAESVKNTLMALGGQGIKNTIWLKRQIGFRGCLQLLMLR